MKLNDFDLEVYFDQHEFTAPYVLTLSDCESMSVADLLALEPGSEALLRKHWLGYTEVAGSPLLREMIATLYQGMDKRNILMHAGAQEAIFAYMNVVLDKGDHMISMFPTYQSIYEVANSQGIAVSKWQLHQSEDGWRMELDELKALIRPNTKLIALNTPNNPTGYTFTRAELVALCEIADQHGIYVFADEVYRGLEPDGQRAPWLADVYDRGISLGVLSKAYGLAGLRLGWLAGRDKELLANIQKYKHYLSICNSGVSELLGMIALKHGAEILQRNAAIIQENLDIADAFFARRGEMFVNNRPMRGPIGFHKLKTGQTAADFCQTVLEQSGVLLLPGHVYGIDEPYFRLGYGRREFAAYIKLFETYLEDLEA